MAAGAFEYARAASWSDAVAQLQAGGEDARVIAGGQSLVPMMMLRVADPALLVDVAGAAPRTIERANGTLQISALARHVDVQHAPAVREACPVLAEAAGQIGNVRVRHRGTIGGSVAHGEPTAEWPCLTVALGATIRALGPGGERAIPAAEMFVTHFTTALQEGEVITRVDVPALAPGQGAAFVELARRAGDFAMVEVAAVVGPGADARVVVGAVADRPLDVSAVVAGLGAAEAGRAVAAEVDIGPSTHASPEYRREMVSVLVRRALLRAAARAEGGVQR